ncbi:hypothetical protein N7540_010643 [Penicillium herquei]|nr:hypothetical protein N7540_010643 [Penicillium herquei]
MPRNDLKMDDVTLGLNPTDIRCLLLGLLVLKYEMNTTDLATITGYKPETARRLFNRALQKLRSARQASEKPQMEGDLNEEIVS